MPIDFLGRNSTESADKKQTEEIKWHMPEPDQDSSEQVQKKVKQVKAIEEAKRREVNLVEIFKRFILKRRLMFLSIFAIICLVIVGLLSYYYFTYQPSLFVTNQPVASPQPSPLVRPSPSPTPSPVFSPSPSPSPAPKPLLPDTELAPIRGSLVKFKDEDTLYLVEDNGELRKVDIQSVIFENGQKIDQVKSSLIYTIADRYKNIRRGKDVYGQVDWDPRVLKFAELSPFLQ